MNELHYATGYDGFPLELHQAMVQDRRRVQAFHQGLLARVKPGDVVVDIGSGTGVLSFLAYKCGASRVIGLERTDIIETARKTKELNFPDAPIEFVRTDARSGRLPEVKADVLVCELLGNFGLEEDIVPILRRVRSRMLRRSGITIPSALDLVACPVQSDEVHAELTGWRRRRYHDIDFSPFQPLAFNRVYHIENESLRLIAKPAVLRHVDLMSVERAPSRMSAEFVASRAAVLHGFVTWFDAELAPSVSLSSGPRAGGTHWGQVFFPVGDPIRVSRGEPIRLDIRTVGGRFERNWHWSGEVGESRNGTRARSFRLTANEAL